MPVPCQPTPMQPSVTTPEGRGRRGAVAHPGIYSLPVGSRVADAIRAAGGYSADVDPRLAEAQLNDAVEAVARRDVTLAQAVVGRDEKLDLLQREIEKKSIRWL